jgi:hypothetical protein
MCAHLILVGSPRGRVSTSSSLASYLSTQIQGKNLEVNILWIIEQLVSEARIEQMLNLVESSESITLVAPLYDDCQPYNVTKTMELISSYPKTLEVKKFIPVINCGFPEPDHITHAAIPIYKMFASRMGFDWLGSLAIGGGEVLQGSSGKTLDEIGGMGDKIKAEIPKIVEAIISEKKYGDHAIVPYPNILLNPYIGRFMIWMNNRSWKALAKKNGQEVDAKPYAII